MEITQLENIEKQLNIEDFDYQFIYRRVFDPNGNPTFCFELFIKNKLDENWNIKNGLLSSAFSVVRTEDVMRKIQEDFGLQPDQFQYIQSGFSIKCDFITNYKLPEESCPVTKADQILFKLLTGIDTEDLNTNYAITFELINGMGGNHSLQLSYGFFQKLSGDQKRLNTNNLFVLDEFRKRLIHNSSMFVAREEVDKVKQNTDNCIKKLASVPATPAFQEELQKVVSKRVGKQFLEMFNELPGEQQNLYYATQILSHIFAEKKDLSLEIRLRNFVSNWVSGYYQK